jgi:hypothetical protein
LQVKLQLKKGSPPAPLATFVTGETDHIRDHHQKLAHQAERAYLDDIEKLRASVDSFCAFVAELPAAALEGQA